MPGSQKKISRESVRNASKATTAKQSVAKGSGKEAGVVLGEDYEKFMVEIDELFGAD